MNARNIYINWNNNIESHILIELIILEYKVDLLDTSF